MIKTEHLTKDYGGGRGLMDLNLEIPACCIFGFVGPNGSGKTTTIRLLCGLIRADRGRAWINGLEVKPSNHVKIKRLIGFLPDEFGVYDQMSVWEYLDFFGAAYKIPPKQRKMRIEEVLEVCDAGHMIDYQVSSLSRGMHQKIGICKTMLHDPDLLILDEPANGLDPHARIEMRETILRLKGMGKTIMISSHILPELGSMCDQVGIIEKGRMLTQGTVRDITRSLQQNMVLEILVDGKVADAIPLLKQIPEVQSVKGSLSEIRVEFVGKRNQIADLNMHLVQNGVKVMGIKEAEVDLENVFLSVTGRADGRKSEHQAHPDAVVHAVDPETNAAVEAARSSVSQFVKSFTNPTKRQKHFAVKMLLSDGEDDDLIWLKDLEFDGRKFAGKLRSDSSVFTGYEKGQPVNIDVTEIGDWMYVDDDILQGGYTIRMKYDKMSEEQKQRFLQNKPYTIAD